MMKVGNKVGASSLTPVDGCVCKCSRLLNLRIPVLITTGSWNHYCGGWVPASLCGKKGNCKQTSCLFVPQWWVHWRAVACTSIFLLHLQPRPSVTRLCARGVRTGAEWPGTFKSTGAEIRKPGQPFLESWGNKLEVRKAAGGITRSHLIISRGKGDPD